MNCSATDRGWFSDGKEPPFTFGFTEQTMQSCFHYVLQEGSCGTGSISALELKHNELAFGVRDSAEGEEKFIMVW